VLGFDPLADWRNPQFFGVPKGTTSNLAFFTDAVMPYLIGNVQSRTHRKTLKDWLIDMDNARFSVGESNGSAKASRS
jgi:hypothetical protein